MSCFKYSFFTRAKTLLLEVLICPREIAPRESRQIQPGDRTHWFSNLVDELLINKPTGRVVPNSSETCMSQLTYESHSRMYWMLFSTILQQSHHVASNIKRALCPSALYIPGGCALGRHTGTPQFDSRLEGLRVANPSLVLTIKNETYMSD